jgi:hypothetical protein
MSVRESINAAMAETKLPRRVVTGHDPLTGTIKTDIARVVDANPNAALGRAPPEHWNVHEKEFQALPIEIRESAHRNTPQRPGIRELAQRAHQSADQHGSHGGC